jgi:hypothetical protein
MLSGGVLAVLRRRAECSGISDQVFRSSVELRSGPRRSRGNSVSPRLRSGRRGLTTSIHAQLRSGLFIRFLFNTSDRPWSGWISPIRSRRLICGPFSLGDARYLAPEMSDFNAF